MIDDLKAQAVRAEPWVRFHWQNLNERKDGTNGLSLRHGRCWLRFRNDWHDGKTIRLEWSMLRHFCCIGFDIDDDGLGINVAFPPIALFFNVGAKFWPLSKWPKRPLSENYPDTMVIDERECGISIHDGTIWIKPWCPKNSWTKADPWWAKGVSIDVNPLRPTHQRHEVRRPDWTWVPAVGSWEIGRYGKVPDGREMLTFPYTYVLKNGTVQKRTATVSVERRAWRPRAFQWTPLFEKSRTSIDVTFDDEVGEKSGSWKGGCIGCGYEMEARETAEQCLRRMERERKF